jgi:hypothetical protein
MFRTTIWPARVDSVGSGEKHTELRRLGRRRGRDAVPTVVAERIVSEDDAGASRQAIADTLNVERVPTARGGAAWRPSSTRSAYLTRRAEIKAQASY